MPELEFPTSAQAFLYKFINLFVGKLGYHLSPEFLISLIILEKPASLLGNKTMHCIPNSLIALIVSLI